MQSAAVGTFMGISKLSVEDHMLENMTFKLSKNVAKFKKKFNLGIICCMLNGALRCFNLII